MLISFPATIEMLPEVVVVSARVFFVAVIFAARLLRSFVALMLIDPPSILAVAKRVDVMLPLVLALLPDAS